jgi:hypothetical protein
VPHAEKLITTCALAGGILATVSDRTSHYFGGYYHVRIQVSAVVPLTVAAFADAAEYEDAVRRLGASVCFSRTLEKMAVPEEELDAVRRHLLEAFDTNLLPYLQRADFADSYVRSEFRNALKSRAVFQRYRT